MIIPAINDPGISPAGLRQVAFLSLALDHAQPVIAQKKTPLPLAHTDTRHIIHCPIGLFFLPMDDRASQQLSHFIIRCPGIAVARCFINDDFPALTAGIRTKSAGTDKRIHIVRFTQFQ